MEFLILLIGLLFGTVLMAGVGERIGLPYPVLMLIFSAAVAYLPFIPEIHIDPELILPLFLPPLLYATAQRSSWAVFRIRWRSLILLAVLLVAVTVAVAAGAAWAIYPAIGVPAAVALGAVVAPPDPVAVESVSGKVNMPRRLSAVLQTEGLFNDAMAIVVFQTAVGAAMSGGDVGWSLVPRFLLGAAGAVLLGLAMAWLVGTVNRFVPTLVARSGTTLVAPFAVYLLADQIGCSGVVAVVVTALEMGRRSRPQDSEERLTRRAFWNVAELLLTGVAFGLVGVEMRSVLVHEGSDVLSFVPGIIAVCVAVVVVRFLWMLGIYKTGGAERDQVPGSLKEVLVLSWCGMRGLATLALALALPTTTTAGDPLPGRNFILACACAVLVVTLVIPGLTLPALMRHLNLPDHHDAEEYNERELARRAQRVALEALHRSRTTRQLPAEGREILLRRMSGLHQLLEHDLEDDPDKKRKLKRTLVTMEQVQREALDAARREILAMRQVPGVDPEAVDRVLRRLDLRTAALEG